MNQLAKVLLSSALSIFCLCSHAYSQTQKWFMGQWYGNIQQVAGYTSPYSGVIEINDYHTGPTPTMGAMVGTSYYPQLNCGGVLQLMSVTASQAILNETITYGSCMNGQIRLNYSGPTQVSYNWYTTWGAQWIVNASFARSEPVICNNPELRSTYSPSTPGYHFYYTYNKICSQGEGSGAVPCNAQNIYGLMLSKLKFVAPPIPLVNENSPVLDCNSYDLLSVTSPNPITTEVEPSILAVFNYTMVGHIFHPGIVGRIVLGDPGGDVYVLTVGTGTGPYGSANEWLGPQIFTEIDSWMRQEFLSL